jgi:hypothetical protein
MSQEGVQLDTSVSAVSETPEAPSRFKVPVDGQEIEVDLDELKRGYSHSRAAAKRMQEAAEIRKREESRRRAAAEGKLDWLTDFGLDEDKLLSYAEKKLLSRIEYEQLPEHEKQLRKAQDEKAKLEKQLSELTAKQRAELESQTLEIATREIDDEISEVVKSFAGKPTPRLIRRIAEAMYSSLERGEAPLPAAKALEKAKRSLNEDVQEFLNVQSPEDLVKSLSKQQLASLRNYFVNEAKSQAPFARYKSSEENQPKTARRGKPMSTDQYFENLEKKFRR